MTICVYIFTMYTFIYRNVYPYTYEWINTFVLIFRPENFAFITCEYSESSQWSFFISTDLAQRFDFFHTSSTAHNYQIYSPLRRNPRTSDRFLYLINAKNLVLKVMKGPQKSRNASIPPYHRFSACRRASIRPSTHMNRVSWPECLQYLHGHLSAHPVG